MALSLSFLLTSYLIEQLRYRFLNFYLNYLNIYIVSFLLAQFITRVTLVNYLIIIPNLPLGKHSFITIMSRKNTDRKNSDRHVFSFSSHQHWSTFKPIQIFIINFLVLTCNSICIMN